VRCAKRKSFRRVILKNGLACFDATSLASKTGTVPAIETLEKLARALEVPLYHLFYDGDEPPKLPNLPKRKSSDDIAWGSVGKDARFLNKLRRLLSKAEEADRKLIMHMAQKMARPNARRAASN
jgi:hypothetical protein